MASLHSEDGPLPPGTPVGRYRIDSIAGSGGMGTVYRARDSELDRDVALKCLVARMRGDPTLRQRFLREARAASKVSSPHVVAVYDVFELEGAPWIAMELIRGPTLRDHLAEKKRLPVRDILGLAEQIAEGLKSAHAQHVLHRDLKPANVMIARDGRAVITDFGLARAFVPPDEMDVASTASDPITHGELVGTLAYMSPEQVLGRPLDARSDIFAFGTVLYELCTGRTPFEATPHAGLRDAILHHEPPAVTLFHPEAPEELARIVRKAMAKDPSERYADVRDVLVDLRSLRQRLERTHYDTLHPARTMGKPRARRAWLIVLLAAGATASAYYVGSVRREDKGVPPPGALTKLAPVTTWPTKEREGRLSPDLEWVSFLSTRDGPSNVWLRKLAGGEPAKLTNEDETILSHVWSPDGNEVAYLVRPAGGAEVRLVPAPLGGGARLVLRLLAVEDDGARLVAWHGGFIYAEDIGRLWRIDTETRAVDAVSTSVDSTFGASSEFDVSPERAVTFITERGGRQRLWVRGANDASPQCVREDTFLVLRPLWMPHGHIAFLSNRLGPLSLYDVALASGEARGLVSPAGVYTVDDVAEDGSAIVVSTEMEMADLRQMDVATGSETPLTADNYGDLNPSFDESDHVIAFQRGRPEVESGARLLDARIVAADVSSTELANERDLAELGYAPDLSPDGRWVAYYRTDPKRDFETELWLLELATRQRRLVTDRLAFQGFYMWPVALISRCFLWNPSDGGLLFVTRGEANETTVCRLGPALDSAPEVLFTACEDGRALLQPALTSDGHELAYQITDRGGDAAAIEIVLADLRARSHRVLHRRSFVRAEEAVRLIGWMPEDRALVLASFRFRNDGTHEATFAGVDRAGVTRSLGAADRAYAQTARVFDGPDGGLYLVRVEDGVANIGVMSLTSGVWRAVTHNVMKGVTYSGLSMRASGTLVYACQTIPQSDVWILQR